MTRIYLCATVQHQLPGSGMRVNVGMVREFHGLIQIVADQNEAK